MIYRELDDFSDQELLDKLERRGIIMPKLEGQPVEKILTSVDLYKWNEWAGVK